MTYANSRLIRITGFKGGEACVTPKEFNLCSNSISPSSLFITAELPSERGRSAPSHKLSKFGGGGLNG